MEAERENKMKETKLKYRVNFKELKKCLSLPMITKQLKKGDIVELVDKELGISRKCKVIEVEDNTIILTDKI